MLINIMFYIQMYYLQYVPAIVTVKQNTGKRKMTKISSLYNKTKTQDALL